MPRRDDDDRDRPSWRDIDKKRDGSLHIDKNDPYASNKKRKGKKSGPTSGYKSALDSFFEGGALPQKFKGLAKAKDLPKGKGSKRQKILKELRDAVGRSEIEECTDQILKMDGELPSDPEVLLSVLRHSDESVVRDAIALLERIAAERPLPRRELMKQRLRQVEDLAEEPDTVEAATALRRKVG